MKAIEVKEIDKTYGDVTALKNVSFDVQHGEMFGLIGPDGAGKTTLFRLLTTLMIPDKGTATVMGFDTVKDYNSIRRISGYMPGKFSLYQDLSVEENLQFFASLFKTTIRENYALIEPIYKQIEPFRNRKAGKLSGGMKQKLALCCALIHRPKVLFLDEPTTGVDAVSRSEFWDMLQTLKQEGITILVSTPYMDEAARCERIALINEGKILHIDTPNNIASGTTDQLYALSGNEMFRLLTIARNYKDIISCFAFGDSHHITVNNYFNEDDFIAYLKHNGFDNINLSRIKAGIEDVFIGLTNNKD